jgi:LCP family protein required for cell wall assembly
VSAVPEDQRPPRLAWGMYKRFLLGGVIVMLCSAAAIATGVLLELHDDASIFRSGSEPIAGIEDALDGVDSGGPQTILILGSDARYSDEENGVPVRSDTMILLRLDPGAGKTAVMSLPRDLKVRIPGHGTGKINEAYADGGPKLSVRTVKQLFGAGFTINHVVNVDFGGFRRAVDRLGCVYTDVDRRYFNDNNPPYGGGSNYAVIDIQAGYQKLCGQDALDFVRYRHFDNDFVRAARQQQFLADAKDQIGVGKLFSDRKALLRIFGRYTQTDISSDAAILRLLKLALRSAQNPVQEIRFPFLDDGGGYVTIMPADLTAARAEFLGERPPASSTTTTTTTPPRAPKPSKGSKARKRPATAAALPAGMQAAVTQGQDMAVPLATKLAFPVYYPRALVSGAEYLPQQSRAYDLFDRGHKRYRAYRMVVRLNNQGQGQYYGVEGTNWPGPPILDNPIGKKRMGGRTFDLYTDSGRLRLVAWRSGRAVYWISNTLLRTLSNEQMLALARSTAKIS